jgi:diguanylate cyclase
MVSGIPKAIPSPTPESELDVFLAQSTLVFRRWSLLIGLVLYLAFTLMDFFRFAVEIYSVTVPVRMVFVIAPLMFATYVHWFKSISAVQTYLSVSLFVYLSAGLVHILIFSFSQVNADTQFSELGFVVLILFGCMMTMLPIIPTAIVSVVLLIIMVIANSLTNMTAQEIVFQAVVYATIICTCLVVNGSLQRVLTSNYHMIQQFYGDSITDRLTGLKNSRFFVKQILTLINKAKAAHKEVALVIIDIDNFKEMNDKHGHSYGDDCLSNLGGILRQVCTRKYDFPCRLAGDEFTIVMYDAKQSEVNKVCQDILTDIQLFDVEVSIGSAITAIDKDTPPTVIKDALFEKADKALYKAKDNGRNNYFSAVDN